MKLFRIKRHNKGFIGLKDNFERINKSWYFPRYSHWVFIILFLALSLFYRYDKYLFYPPQSFHQWRQCDCLSLTTNYTSESNKFHEPSMHFLGYDGTGRTISDFPLIYWSVGQIWKLTGKHEYIYRLLVLLIFMTGLLSLFKITESLTRDSLIGISTGLLLYTSPTLSYYAGNFLMDIPALSLAMIGLYFFFRYYATGNVKFLLITALFYMVGGLLKIPSFMSFVAITAILFFELLGIKMKNEGKIFQKPVLTVFLIILIIAIQFTWYSYAIRYNDLHNAGIFLIGILPVWDLDKEGLTQTIDAILDHVRHDYFRPESQLIFVFILITILVFHRRLTRSLVALNLLLATGFIMFIILFFQPLRYHDYYATNLFIVVPVVLTTFFVLLKSSSNKMLKGIFPGVLMFIFLFWNASFAAKALEGRYDPDGWPNEFSIANVRSYYNTSEKLQELGIHAQDKVVVPSDPSINISLYMMDRKGWTNYWLDHKPERLASIIGMGGKYLLIRTSELENQDWFRPFVADSIGNIRDLSVFRLKDPSLTE